MNGHRVEGKWKQMIIQCHIACHVSYQGAPPVCEETVNWLALSPVVRERPSPLGVVENQELTYSRSE